MALTHNGSRVDIPVINLPDGYDKPSITTFTDFEFEDTDKVFTFDRADVEDPDPLTTMDNCLAELNTLIDNYLTQTLNVGSTDFESYGLLKDIRLNTRKGEALFTDDILQFICIVDVRYKTTV